MKTNHHVKVQFSFVYFAYYALLVFYQMLSSVYYWMPPLFGIFFCYMIILLKEQKKTLNRLDFRWYFALLYILYAGIIHGFYLFSPWIAFFIFYHFFVDWFRSKMKLGAYFLVLFVVCTYIFIYIFDVLLSYLDNSDTLSFGLEYLWFVFFEAIISYIIFREKI